MHTEGTRTGASSKGVRYKLCEKGEEGKKRDKTVKKSGRMSRFHLTPSVMMSLHRKPLTLLTLRTISNYERNRILYDVRTDNIQSIHFLQNERRNDFDHRLRF